jgi:hypothetical protein
MLKYVLAVRKLWSLKEMLVHIKTKNITLYEECIEVEHTLNGIKYFSPIGDPLGI